MKPLEIEKILDEDIDLDDLYALGDLLSEMLMQDLFQEVIGENPPPHDSNAS